MKAIVIVKSKGIGDLCILTGYIQAISKKLSEPISVLAQKKAHPKAIFEHDPHIKEIIELDEKEIKGFFNIIKVIKERNFNTSYIFNDSVRFYLISRLSGINKNFQYRLFSKKGKNFFLTAKKFSEKVCNTTIETQSKIFSDENKVKDAVKKYELIKETKNIICGISASGETKRWDIKNFIRLFSDLQSKFKCKFFLAGGQNDESLIQQILKSPVGGNCVSFSKMSIAKTIPIIAACQYYIGNDTGFGHISAGLNLKSLFLFMDSPPTAYGIYNKNISIVVPEGETIESCSHNTRGKNRIKFEKVLNKTLELLN